MSRLLSFEVLKRGSFVHSAVYVVLLVVWLVPGLAAAEFVFGLGHGIGWIVMSVACILALRLGRISLRLAVAVVVLGGVGPFFGTLAFLTSERGGAGARVRPTQWP